MQSVNPEPQHRNLCNIAQPREEVCKALSGTSLSTPCVPPGWSISYGASLDNSPGIANSFAETIYLIDRSPS